jgi:hypothetical protein
MEGGTAQAAFPLCMWCRWSRPPVKTQCHAGAFPLLIGIERNLVP